MLKSVKISSDVGKADIEIDGQRLQGVIAVDYNQSIETIPNVTLTCISNRVNLDFELADVKFVFKNNWISVDKLLPDVGTPVLALIKDKNGLHQEVLTRQYFEESDAIYEGIYWCSYRTLNIEALGINTVIAWQNLPSEELI